MASNQSAETQSILMSPHGLPDKFIFGDLSSVWCVPSSSPGEERKRERGGGGVLADS